MIHKQIEDLNVYIYPSAKTMGEAAAQQAAKILNEAVASKGEAFAVFATGNSQLEFLDALLKKSIPWSNIHLFHMDEYIGISDQHPASFRKFLKEKLVDKVQPASFHGVLGDAADSEAECKRYAQLLSAQTLDLVCMGIGENGHIAFNDPPFADFNDPELVKIVTLDETSRKQQVGEGHFPNLDAVPRDAITLTIPALLSAKHALVIVPETRKAKAVATALHGPIIPDCPASILRKTSHATLYLDADAASALEPL
jgi:glucosamine-6-phosphate deaminase